MVGTYDLDNKSPNFVEGAEYIDQLSGYNVLEVDFHTWNFWSAGSCICYISVITWQWSMDYAVKRWDKIRPYINWEVFHETGIKLKVLHHVVIKSWALVITDQIPIYVINVELK
jgi:hypothetical protein